MKIPKLTFTIGGKTVDAATFHFSFKMAIYASFPDLSLENVYRQYLKEKEEFLLKKVMVIGGVKYKLTEGVKEVRGKRRKKKTEKIKPSTRKAKSGRGTKATVKDRKPVKKRGSKVRNG